MASSYYARCDGAGCISCLYQGAQPTKSGPIGVLPVQTLYKRSSWLLYIPCVSRLRPLSGVLIYAVTRHCTTVLSTCANLKPALDVILPYKFGVFEDDGSIIGLEPHLSHTRFSISTLDPAFILDMSVTFGVDLEAGVVSEQSKFRGAGMVGAYL
jgi:hypothetical protein